MPPDQIVESYFSPDIRDFLLALHEHEVRYVIVGGEAVILYGHARYTGDVDFFYEPSEANARLLFTALTGFWEGKIPGVSNPAEFLEPRIVIQFGRPPNRIDLLNHIDAVSFGEAWATRHIVDYHTGERVLPLNYLHLEHLVRNKRATGRPKDLDDVRYLGAASTGA